MERDRKVVEQIAIDGYDFWLRTGHAGCCHSFDHDGVHYGDGVHYEWGTTVLNSEGEAAGTNVMPQPETVTETIVIVEYHPGNGVVCEMGPREIKALLIS
jgi:hypothetical protein